MKRGYFSSLVSTALLLLVAGGVEAGTVYQWTDGDGITHFSDTPPDAATGAVTTASYDALPPATNPEDDYFSITNQLKRMQESRLAEERARAAAKPAEPRVIVIREQGKSAPEQQVIYAPVGRYYHRRRPHPHPEGHHHDRPPHDGISIHYSNGNFSAQGNSSGTPPYRLQSQPPPTGHTRMTLQRL